MNNKIIKLFLIFIILLLVISTASCDKKLEKGSNEDIQVICIIGQSNASGCSKVSYLEDNIAKTYYKTLNKGLDNIYIDYKVDGNHNSNNFVHVKVGQGASSEHFGIELGLADRLNEYNKKIVIIKYTWGGTSLIESWYHHEDSNGDLYNSFIQMVHEDMKKLKDMNYNPYITDICFMQGENDAVNGKHDMYYDELQNMVKGIRSELNQYKYYDDIYFIDAYISDSIYWTNYKIVNEAKYNYSIESAYNILIDTLGTNYLTYDKEPSINPDLAHYDSLSELKLGKLFGEEISKHIF